MMQEPESSRLPTPDRIVLRRRVAVLLWRAVALLSLALGVIGMALPVMPTVPFLLVSAWAASKGWPAFELWLIRHPRFGPPIVQWRERGAGPRRLKWFSTLAMTASAIGIQFFDQIPLPVRIGVPAVMAAVGIWLWFRPES